MIPTIIDGAEVINDEGTLALTIDGYDAFYLNPSPKIKLTPEDHQEVIDVIVKALGVNNESE
jgi:hypothetical protein